MKKWIAVQMIIVIAALLVGQVCRLRFKDIGIASLKTVEDTYHIENCGLEFCFGDNSETKDTEEELYQNLCEYEKEYVSDVDQISIAVVAKATGSIKNSKDSFGQEIQVEKVLKGKEFIDNGIYYVYSNENFEMDKYKQIRYSGMKNVMKPDQEYLIFLEASELNPYTDEKSFYLRGSFFSYLNLTKDSAFIMPDKIEDTQYKNLESAEFFATSTRILEQLVKIKHEIIERYIAL